MNYLIERLPNGDAGIVYRMAPDGGTSERYDWGRSEWVDDPRLIEKMLDGADLDGVTEAAAKAAITSRKKAFAKAAAKALIEEPSE